MCGSGYSVDSINCDVQRNSSISWVSICTSSKFKLFVLEAMYIPFRREGSSPKPTNHIWSTCHFEQLILPKWKSTYSNIKCQCISHTPKTIVHTQQEDCQSHKLNLPQLIKQFTCNTKNGKSRPQEKHQEHYNRYFIHNFFFWLDFFFCSEASLMVVFTTKFSLYTPNFTFFLQITRFSLFPKGISYMCVRVSNIPFHT